MRLLHQLTLDDTSKGIMRGIVRRYREEMATLRREHEANLNMQREHEERYFGDDGAIRPEFALYRRCSVCGSDDAQPFIPANPYVYVECSDCGFRYMNPIIDPDMTTILTSGISDYRQTVLANPREPHVRKRMTQQMREILAIKSGGAFLDVGCGLGRHLGLAAERFTRAEGIELDSASVQYCRESGLTVYDKPLDQLALPHGEYDVVLMNQVIEHLTHPEKVCREVFELLKSGGILYIDTPNFHSWAMRFFKERNNTVIGSGHISLFGVASLTRMLRGFGLEVAKANTYQTDLFPFDVGCFLANRTRFRHRRNLQIPLYLPLYRLFHEVFDERIFRNLGRSIGSYMRVVARKV